MRRPTNPSLRTGFARGAVMAALVGLSVGLLGGCGSSDPPVPSASLGTVVRIPVPATPLVDEGGHATSLSAFQGRYVVLAPFLTLCQDECPLTTGAFQVMQQAVARAGLADQVVFVEATIDPDRDTPARLSAYRSTFGADWTLLTGTSGNIAALWKHFGIFYQKVPVDDPSAMDWLTHQPLTYDVNHTNGFILIDRSGVERFITQDLPQLNGQLSLQLRSLLDDQGVDHLEHGIPGQSWTIPQGLQALSWLVGKNIRPPS
jgi:protein SCO1/2